MEQFWTPITGVAAVAGVVVAAVAAYYAWRGVSDGKHNRATDLRLQLSKDFDAFNLLASEIRPFMLYVQRSHANLLISEGQTGARIGFESEFVEDMRQIDALLESRPHQAVSYDDAATGEMEQQLIAVHASHVRLSALREKYGVILAADDDLRKQKRLEVVARVNWDSKAP